MADDECVVDEKHPVACAVNTTQSGQDAVGGCCPKGTTCTTCGCLQALRKHFMPRTVIARLFRSDKADDTVSAGVKFGEVGVKSSVCHSFLRPSLVIVSAVIIMVFAAIM
jgi:hypothetical protein